MTDDLCRFAIEDGRNIRRCELPDGHLGECRCTVYWDSEPSKCVITWWSPP